MPCKASVALVVILLATLFTSVSAIEADPAESPGVGKEVVASEEIQTLGQVTVVGQVEDALTVSETISREKLDSLPQKNGSINEALSTLPGIQLGEFHRTSDNAGEILPPDLSISGGRIYENNFTIDGFSNNSLLDPTYRDIDNNDNVPGHPQKSFLHPSLVENITVYRANIPAKYGNFTGGVVDVATRDPSGAFGGEISLHHTRSEWTEFHKDSDRDEEYSNPVTGGVQPEFRKYNGSILFDIPITEQTGILASYTLIHSEIPLYQIQVPENLIEKQNQFRSIENFFLKSVTHLNDSTKLSFTGSYNPYEAEYFQDETVNSEYTLENYAYSVTSRLEHRAKNAEIEFGLGYSLSTNSRQAPDLFFTWQVTDSKPWGAVTDAGAARQYSKEGGSGNVEKEEETLTADIHVTLDPVGSDFFQHNFGFGLKFEQSEGHYDRTEEFTHYSIASKNANVLCNEKAIDCINYEQFMWYKTVYPEDKAAVRFRFYDAYIDDRIKIGQLTLRPGIRISKDDLQDNTNLAPRFAADYDLFGNGRTNIYTGFNRYYGKTLMTHALNEQKADSQNWSRPTSLSNNQPKEWAIKPRTSIAATQLSDLETPYSDEIVFGVDQSLFDGMFKINYLEREGENELASKLLEIDPDTGYKYTEWTNNGRSRHKEASVSWERTWLKHSLFIAATWQETETSNSNYTEYTAAVDKDDDGSADPVWYHGSLVDRSDLPRPDFNRDFVCNLVYTAKLPYNTTFTNVTQYRSGYKALENTGEDKVLLSGLSYDIYEEVKRPESWVFDWLLEWEVHIMPLQSLTVSLELNNVFNQRTLAGNSDDTYELGRQFWLGMTYTF
jgi:hypothetical protein